MLRVNTERQGDSYRLDLHGTLGGYWVGVLEQHWRSIMDHVPSATVTLVLSNVDFIDPDGEQLLQRMADEDVDFVVAECMNRYVIDKLKPTVRAAEGGRHEMFSQVHSDGSRSAITVTLDRRREGCRSAAILTARARVVPH
jgi:hypothetical protein